MAEREASGKEDRVTGKGGDHLHLYRHSIKTKKREELSLPAVFKKMRANKVHEATIQTTTPKTRDNSLCGGEREETSPVLEGRASL